PGREAAGLAGGGASALDGVDLGGAVATLLTVALEQEQRVVDADSETDHRDEHHAGFVHDHDAADDLGKAGRGDDGDDTEDEREAGRDEGAEDDDQDDGRDGQADLNVLLHVLAIHLADLAAAEVADRADAEAIGL